MPDKWPLANGNWSDAANWNGGTKPVAGDDVFADGKTIAIDESINIATLRTTQRSGGTLGGGFTVTATGLTLTVTSGIRVGNSIVITVNMLAGTLTINGNSIGQVSTNANNLAAIYNLGAGTINVNGSVSFAGGNVNNTTYVIWNAGVGTINFVGAFSPTFTGGMNNQTLIHNSGGGTINIVGSVVPSGGDTGSGSVFGCLNSGAGTINITGSVTGGVPQGSSSAGVHNSGTGTTNIVGDCSAALNGSGAVICSAGTVTITGSSTAGTLQPAVRMTAGTVVANGLATANSVNAIVNTGGLLIRNGNDVSSSTGVLACQSVRTLIDANSSLTHTYRVNNAGIAGAARSLYTTNAFPAVYPANTDVRSGTVYANGTITGTLVVPGASSVAAGVVFDANTVGTAVLTAAGLRAAMGLALPNLDAQLASITVDLSPVLAAITALNNLSAKANIFGALLLEVPESGTRAYQYELVIKDDEDKLVNLDGSPTWTLVNSAGTNRSALITSTSNIATGRYGLTITVDSATVNESLKLSASGTVSGESRFAVTMPQVVDYDSATQINTLLTRIPGVIRTSIEDASAESAQTTAIRTGLALTADLQPAVTAALNAYDPPTRAEATADKQSVLDAVNNLDVGGIDTDALAQDIVDRLAEIEANPMAIVQSPSTSGPLWAYQATTWSIRLANLPAATDWRRVWFSIKQRDNQSDDAAIVRIQKSSQTGDQATDGLQRIAGRAAAQGETGSLAVTQATPTLTIDITLSAAGAAVLKAGEYLYDLKVKTTSGVELKVEPDAFEIRPSITRAVT